MRTGYLILLLLTLTTAANAQMISRFNWSSMPLTTAVAGPNGTSVSSSAVSVNIGGALGYAINPGTPVANIDLVVPGSPAFDVNSIYVDLYFRREENVASFIKRGSLFDFGMNGGSLYVIFTTTQGSTPGNITINSGNIVAIADDHQFHRYRFAYDNNTGVGRVWVDNTLVYTYNGVAGRPLAWTGAGNVVIGEQMDASGRNLPVLSNLTVQQYSNSVLPATLTDFSARMSGKKAVISWETSSEFNISQYIIEKSNDGNVFKYHSATSASNDGHEVKNYELTDETPWAGTNYYRLKIVDHNGTLTYSKVIKLNNDIQISSSCFPNPASSFIGTNVHSASTGTITCQVFTSTGVLCASSKAHVNAGENTIKISLAGVTAKGNLYLRITGTAGNQLQSIPFIKL